MKRNGVAIMLCAMVLILCGFGAAWAVTYAYIPSHDNDSVVRVDTAAGTFDSVIFDANTCSPYGAAVAPNGSFAMITCSDQNAVAAVTNSDFEGGTAPGTTSVGNDPRGVAIDPLGDYAYVANFEDDNVTVINVDTLAVIDTVSVGDGPFGVAAIYQESASRIKIYVSNYNAGTVSVITQAGFDLTVGTIEAVGTNPVGVAATPDGKFVYVANYNNGLNGTVTVIKTEDDTIVQTIQAGRGPWGVALGAKGQYAFVSNSQIGANSITMITTSDFTHSTFTVGISPFGVAAPKNGDFAYSINQGSGNPISKIGTTMLVTPIQQDGNHTIEGAFALGAFIGGTPPVDPAGLTVTAEGDNVKLAWTDNSDDELGFKIERRVAEETDSNATDESDTSAFTEIKETAENATEFTDTTAVGGISYEYRIRAFNEAADSDYVAGNETATPVEEDFSWCFIDTLLN